MLRLRGICKRFGPVTALCDVDLDALAGEVHVVLGENGAGKSTLMNVACGMLAPDAGTIGLDDSPVRWKAPADARRAGIGMVHQELALVDALSVAENLALCARETRSWWWRRAGGVGAARGVAAELGLDLGDLDAPAGTLPVGQRQRIEIVKALAGAARLLILDEPTAMLAPTEVAQLFAMLDRLRRSGTAVLFITHRLAEVSAIADRVTVMRHGRVVARVERGDYGEADLAALMVGPLQPPAASAIRERAPGGPPALLIDGVSVAGPSGVPALAEVSFAVGRGEVFGIAGVDGNGQAELFEVLAGLRAPEAGAVVVAGTPIHRFEPAAMAAAGIAAVPPDRRRQGTIGPMTVRENALLNKTLLRHVSPGWLTHPAAERRAAQEMVDAYAIKAAGLDAPAQDLSGGNLQKLVVARALALAPRVLVAANPARGLDIAAAEAVYAAVDAARARGTAVLLISTDLDEVVARAHRLAVLYRGRLSPVLARPFPLARLGALMAGA